MRLDGKIKQGGRFVSRDTCVTFEAIDEYASLLLLQPIPLQLRQLRSRFVLKNACVWLITSDRYGR